LNLIFITIVPGKLSDIQSQVYIIGRENDKIRDGFVKEAASAHHSFKCLVKRK